ncbi:hypothetical protein RV11_GL000033 [Enterococcus phoeniculicola]|nr:hypothetical protein RV11_GL000033 [Enterococcus phoeniculicola]
MQTVNSVISMVGGLFVFFSFSYFGITKKRYQGKHIKK